MQKKSAEQVKLRKARESDSFDIFSWRNDPETRKNSIAGGKKIPYENHKTWFEAKLKNTDTRIYVATWGKYKVGVLRFEIEKDFIEIGTNVNPAFRGKGFGTKIIGLGARKMYKETKKPVIARIKNDNVASIKMCAKNRFFLQKKENDISTLCFKKRKGDESKDKETLYAEAGLSPSVIKIGGGCVS